MTAYSDRADETLLILKNIARDLESHLGLANRTREHNPNLNDPTRFAPVGNVPADIARTRVDLRNRILTGYRNTAAAAVSTLKVSEPASPTAPELTSRNAVTTLATSIQSVTDHAGAIALVATL